MCTISYNACLNVKLSLCSKNNVFFSSNLIKKTLSKMMATKAMSVHYIFQSNIRT